MSELYSLPKGWEWKKLEDLFTITSSKRVLKEDWLEKGIPFYRAREIVKLSQNGFVDNELFISEEMYNSFSKKYGLPKVNDILVTGVGTLGITYIVKENEKFYFKDGNIIWLKNDSNTNSKYIEYGFQTEFLKNQINSNSGSTVATYTITNANNTIIPIPPLEEQKRIVAKLNILFAKIDKAIALHQKNIDEANVFMASVLNDVFVELEEKYEKFNINKIATVKGGKRVPKGYTLSEEVTPYPYLRVTDFKDYGTICTKKMLYLTEEVHEQIKRYTITDEDLYITNVGNTIGKSGIIPSELNGANLTENAVKLVYKDKKNTSNKFMYYFTKTSIFLIQLESATMQMAVPKLAIMRLGEIELPFPPIETQQKVVSYLDEISNKMEKIKQIQKEKMQSLKELKASILDKAFKGEL